jgi:hypothetical protein
MFVALLSYRLRKRVGGVVVLFFPPSTRAENMLLMSSSLLIFAGLLGGPTKRKWSRKA